MPLLPTKRASTKGAFPLRERNMRYVITHPNGENPKTVQHNLGHADVGLTLQIYAHKKLFCLPDKSDFFQCYIPFAHKGNILALKTHIMSKAIQKEQEGYAKIQIYFKLAKRS